MCSVVARDCNVLGIQTQGEAKMEARTVNIANGWIWIKQGYWLFKKSPVLLVVLTAIAVVSLMGIAAIPVVGDPLATLLFPVIFAGFMLGCRALEHGEELELAHLFAGFHGHATQLVALGGINLVSQLLILGAMALTGGATLVSILMSGHHAEDPTVLTQAIAGAGLALLLGIALFTLLLMAMQFAPMLILFDKISPVTAMKTSFRACLHNLMPLMMYGAMLLPFAILASVPLMMGWLILLPVMITSLYAAYRDLFPTEVDTDATTAGETNGQDEQAHF